MFSLRSSCQLINSDVYLHQTARRLMTSKSTRLDALNTLGLSSDASKEDIKAAYLRLSKQLHPDVSGSVHTTERWQQVKEAYDQLQVSQEYSTIPFSPTIERSGDYDRWKERQKKNKGIDDWLKKVQRDSRYKMKRTWDLEDKEQNFRIKNVSKNINRNQYKFDVDYEHHYSKTYSEIENNYGAFEKNFISYLDKFNIKTIEGLGPLLSSILKMVGKVLLLSITLTTTLLLCGLFEENKKTNKFEDSRSLHPIEYEKTGTLADIKD